LQRVAVWSIRALPTVKGRGPWWVPDIRPTQDDARASARAMGRARRAVRPWLRHGSQSLCNRLLEARSGLLRLVGGCQCSTRTLYVVIVTVHHGPPSWSKPWQPLGLSTTPSRVVNRRKIAQSSVSDPTGHPLGGDLTYEVCVPPGLTPRLARSSSDTDHCCMDSFIGSILASGCAFC